MSARRIVLLAAAGSIVVAGALPVLAILARSASPEGHSGPFYLKHFISSTRSWLLLSRSFTISGLTTLLCMAVGLPLGILCGRTNLPFRRALAFLFAIPLAIPPYIIAVLWSHILGREGFAARFIGLEVAAEEASRRLFGLPGCILVQFTALLPVVLLLVMVLLKTVNPRLEEAGRLAAGWPGVLRSVTIPLILPGILLAAMLVFLLSFGEYGVPMFLRYDVFPVEAFTQFAAFHDFGAAAAASLPLVLLTLLVLAIEQRFLRGHTYRLRPLHGSASHVLMDLGTARGAVFVGVAALSGLLVLLPLSAMVSEASSAAVLRDALARAGDSLLRSLLYASSGATVLTLVGFFLGYLIHNRALPIWRSVDSLSFFLFALPSTVIGIGLVAVWNHSGTSLIYSTPAILMLGYLAQYCVLSSRISVSSLVQIPAAMEEAAQVAGAGWLRGVVFVVAPLCARGIAGSWIVTYIFCLRDTGISLMVYPPGSDTLPVRIFTLMANGSAELIAALCLIMSVAAMAPLALGAAVLHWRRERRP